ncbi:hypothetical protein NHX12_007090 [Muraenolepis orangiensis]|uniref:Uncharacterized protein n=1 Tax=Muraenolepis orangiensis TaxID=630683 RepID=A0A9Q0DNG2_9TELE|nr:hypothetical protein NHX12_007090 [Muraenolepis orangiensis]
MVWTRLRGGEAGTAVGAQMNTDEHKHGPIPTWDGPIPTWEGPSQHGMGPSQHGMSTCQQHTLYRRFLAPFFPIVPLPVHQRATVSRPHGAQRSPPHPTLVRSDHTDLSVGGCQVSVLCPARG